MTEQKTIHKGNNKTIILNSSVLYIRLGIVLFLSLFSTRYVLEGLGESNFGIYNLIAGIVALFGFISATMAGITQRFLSYGIGATQDLDYVRLIFNTSIRLHLIIAVIVTFLILSGGLLLIRFVLNIPTENIYQANYVLFLTSLGVLFTVIGIPFEAILMAHENIVFVAIIQIVSSVLKFLAALYLLYLSKNQLIIYSSLMAVIPFLTVLAQGIYSSLRYKETKIIKISLINNPLRKEMQSFAGLTLWGNMGWAIRNQGTSIILNIFFGVLINAANGIANQVNGALMSLSSALTTSIRPQLVQNAGEKNFERMISLGFSACKYPIIFIAMIGAPILIGMPIVLKIWLNDIPAYTVLFCRFLIIDLIINQSTYGIALILDAVGKIRNLHLLVGCSLILITVVSYYVGKFSESPASIYWCIIANAIIIAIIRLKLVVDTIKDLGYYEYFKKQFLDDIIKPILFLLGLILFLYFTYKLLPSNIIGIIELMATSFSVTILLTLILFIDKKTLQKIIKKLH